MEQTTTMPPDTELNITDGVDAVKRIDDVLECLSVMHLTGTIIGDLLSMMDKLNSVKQFIQLKG